MSRRYENNGLCKLTYNGFKCSGLHEDCEECRVFQLNYLQETHYENEDE